MQLHTGYHGSAMGHLSRPLIRSTLVGLFVLLSLFGIPAMAYFLRPQRTKDDIAIELVAGAEEASA